MIKLFFIAADATALPWLSYFSTSSEITVEQVWCEQAELKTRAQQVTSSLKYCDSWTDLTTSSTVIDALFIAGVSEEVLTAARQFLESSTAPIFILTETSGPVAPLFQFMNLWQEAPLRIIPLFTSGIAGTCAVAQHKLGEPVKRVVFHRQLEPAKRQEINLDEFDQAFLQDLDWMQALGPFSHVTTWLTGEDQDRAIEATVTLTGEAVPETKWTLSRAIDAPRWQLVLHGEHETLTVECARDRHPQLRKGEHQETLPIPEVTRTELLSAIQQALNVAPSERRTWMDVVRNGEVGAAARRSIARKRTIAIYFEDASERSHFKSQMTAIGCGVLLWIMFGVIAVLTMASIVDPRDRELRAASAAGFVLHADDFRADTAELNADGAVVATHVSRQWSETTPVLIIEEIGIELDQQRERVMEQHLTRLNLRDVESKVVVRPLTGEWFEKAMWGAWAIVFLPLAVILIAQGLLFVARPMTEE